MKSVGSDASLGMSLKNTIMSKNSKLTRIKKKLGLYFASTQPC